MDDLELNEFDADDCPVVTMSGELTHATAPDLRGILRRHFGKGRTALLLDMSGVTFMDTSGLATLIEARNNLEKQGGFVALCGLQPRIAEILDITRVRQLFQIFASQEEARKAVGEPDE